jgi:hypothetical protein
VCSSDLSVIKYWWRFNAGFMRILPSPITTALYEAWLVRALSDMKNLSQIVLHVMLRDAGILSVKDLTVRFDVAQYVSNDLSGHPLSVRFYDSLFVHHGDMMLKFREAYVNRSLSENVDEPYVCHLAWIHPKNKTQVFTQAGLWFLHKDQYSCRLPNKRFFRRWNRSRRKASQCHIECD